MPKNLLLQSPSAADIEDIFNQGAEALSSQAPATPSPQPAEARPTPSPQSSAGRAVPTKDDLIRRARELDIDPNFALSIFTQESSGNFGSKDSPKGAAGGMQVMPDTYKSMMGTYSGQRDPWNNMEAGLRYIAYGQKTLGTRDPALLAAGYHAGYDRSDLKRGIIPENIGDGMIKTKDYAASVARRVGASPAAAGIGARPADIQAQLDKDDPGRYKVMTPEEADTFERTRMQSDLDAREPGRFKVMTEEEAAKFEPQSPSLWENVTDAAKNLKVGANVAAQDARELASRILPKGVVDAIDSVDTMIHGKPSEQLLKEDTQKVVAGMTPQMQGALQKQWWDDKKGTLGDAWKDWRSYTGGLLQSLPEQSLTMVPALGLAKAAYAARVGVVGVQAASQVAARTAMVAGALSEGALGGAQSSRQVRDAINGLDFKTLAESDAFKTFKAQGMTDEQARAALADDSATRAFVVAGVATGMFGGMGDRAIAKIFTEKASKSAIKRVLAGAGKGVVGEGLFEELPQSALQQMAQNEATQRADKKVSLFDDVANQALGGMAIGGLQGGGMGAVAGAANQSAHAPDAPAAPEPAQRIEPQVTIPPAPAAAEPAASGPIGRSIEKSEGRQLSAEPADLPRVQVTLDNGQTMTGFAERIGPDGSGRVIGDDGQVYKFTAEDGVTITPVTEEPAAAPALEEPAAVPAETAPVAEEKSEQPAVNAEVAPVEPAPAAPETKPETKAAVPSEPAPREQHAYDRPLTEWSNEELRDRLRYVTKQANVSGWNAMLVKERARVSSEINSRNIEAAKPAQKPEKPAASEQPKTKGFTPTHTDQYGTPLAKVGEEWTDAEGVIHENPDATPIEQAKAQEHAAPAVITETEKVAPAAQTEKDAHAGKWFGSREKADAYLAKKKAVATHEVVQTGKVRFEVKPKADDGAQPHDAAPSGTVPGKTVSEHVQTRAERISQRLRKKRGASRGEAGYTLDMATQDMADVKAMRQQEGADIEALDTVTAQLAWHIDQMRKEDVATETSSTKKDAPAGQAPDAVKNSPSDKPASAPAPKKPRAKGEPLRSHRVLGDATVGDAVTASADIGYSKGGQSYEIEKIGRNGETTVRNIATGSSTTWSRADLERAARQGVTIEKQQPANGGENLDNGTAPSAEQQAEANTDATPSEGGKADPFAGNKLFTSDKVEAARARLKAKLSGTQLNSGIDPELLMDGMVIAGAYIETGVRNFTQYAARMTADLGEGVKPYLLSFWEGARNYPGLDTEGMTSVEESKRLHAEMVTPEVKAAAAEAIGETPAKPAKRTKKTGAAGDTTLTQDWGVDHIDGWEELPGGKNEQTDYGLSGGVKDAFLKEARDYLRAAERILAERGYAPQPDKKGRTRKGVSVNEAGPAVSGDVSLTVYNAEIGTGIYATIGAGALRGMVPTTSSGVQIMFRATEESDPYGSRGSNQWAPVDLSAADLAAMMDAHARNMARPSKQATMQSEEVAQNERPTTDGSADAGAPEQSPGSVPGYEIQGDAGRVSEPADRANRGSDRGGSATSDRGIGERGQPRVRAERAAPDAGTEQSAEGGRGNRDRAGDGDDRGAVSRVGNDYRINPDDLKRTGSWKSTAEQNIRIVELVKQLEKEGRRPTTDEAALLTKFTGWGASDIANGVFPNRYGQFKPGWEELGQRLKAALTEEEYAQASRTTQYAHYTSPQVIGSIYDALRRIGFAGGKVLEPGMGIGLFKGLMPAAVAAASQYTGVEYDPITGKIAQALYPESNIIVGDYTKTGMPREFFDAAIGNPPFSSTVITNDPEYKKQGFMLHDYFFAKTLDRVKPGGMLVFVTSKGTMDKGSDRARKYLGERANLLGAIRLPQTAFKDNAGTEVVTDVIFLQKRGDGVPDNGVKWMGTAEVKTPQGPAQINEYFAAHPEMVLGAHALTGSMYRANEYTVVPEAGVDMDAAFAKAVQNLPEGVYQPGAKNPAASTAIAQDRDFNPTHKKEGGLYVSDDGRLMQVDSGSGIEMTHRRGADGKQIALKPSDKAFLKSWVGLRDALKQAQLDQLTDGNWESSLAALGAAYDAFVAKHGNVLAYSTIERTGEDGTVTVSKRFKNDPLLRLDVDGALAHSLEHIKESGEIVKAPVLTERVLEKKRPPEIKTTQDALFVSLNELGSLDMDDVARRAGMSRSEVIEALGTAIYEEPGAGWQTADAYLSGNVVRKLKEAQTAARNEKRYQRNIEALLAVQPKPLGPTDITVKLGQNWIPTSDVAAFASEVLGENIDVSYQPRLGSWSAEQRGSNYGEYNTPNMSAGAILDYVLNNRQIKITFRDSEGKTHVDAEATEKANDVARKMRDAFSRWIWTDTKRADRLVNYYNENFNNIAPRQFDGSHLTLPGVSLRFNLYPHQKRAIWRMIQEGDTYLAHSVGAGKTFTMIAAGMEERRLGLSNKPMYVVPNHMLAQFAREFLELYPAANIMVADEQNFHTHNRRRFVAQAALNNPDAIIITHSAFGRIGMSDEYASQFISDQIDEWKMALDETDKSDRISRKQIERRIEQLERRLEARQGGDKKDKVLAFEELGVDRLFVDEAHEFRKLDFATNQGNIKGIDPTGSQRAMDLFMKVQYLRGRKPGRALVAASGTPITNTMGELYTVQRLFQPEQMNEDGLDTFDAWSNQYGDVVAGFEQNAAGGYEVVSRFAKFQNVPELMRRVRSFMDILTSASLGELVQRPAVDGGGRQVVVTPEPDGYRAFQKELETRIAAIRRRKGPPKKGDDIILKVISDGRFSAIDMRFVDPSLPSDPKSKLNRSIDDLISAYRETADYEYATNGQIDPIKGSSLILFTDIGLGEQSAASRGFDMKAWIEQRLTEAGIPRDHLAFMRDHKEHAKKERLFADMREGKKRILIGGKDMETGVNVQKRLEFLGHLDAPWFPASVEQREGRIVRQGNQNKKVRVRAYATKGSYDSTMWGMNGRKARFIEQALNGDYSVRSLEDVSEASAFEMASALASGDERYMKLAGLKSDVDRLERLRYAHYDDQNNLRREKHYAETAIERNTKLSEELSAAIAKRQPIRAGEFSGKVGKTSYDNREEFSTAVFDRTKALASKHFDGEQQIGEVGGFPITYYGLTAKGSGNYMGSVELGVPGDPSPLLNVPLDRDVAVAGIATRAANQVNSLDRQKAEAEEYIAKNKRKIEQIEQRIGAPFPEEAELLDKVANLQALETELTAEKAEQGEPAPSADAAAATVEVEGHSESAADQVTTGDEPRYSINDDGLTVGEFGPVTEEFRTDPAGAIRWLQQQRAGEAIVDHPTLGEISLIWGDGTMGLSHIARRHGENFLSRIPEILKETQTYEKPRQNMRVFLGNDRDEAAIRLDWDGQAKAWLVSAYEKHGDVKPSLSVERSKRSAVVERRGGRLKVDGLREEITKGVVGQVIYRLIDNGHIVLHQNAETLPKAARGKRGVQAVTLSNGQIHLVANRLTAGSARPVLLHEMFHTGGEALVGTKEWGNLMGRLGSLYRQSEQSNGRAREFFDRARARVAYARNQGAIATGMSVEEFGAYAIEEYERRPASLPGAIRKWVEDVIGQIKAYVLARYGKQIGAVTPAQLAGLAKMVIMNAAVMAERGELSGVTGKFSVSEPEAEKAIDAANASLDQPERSRDYIASVVNDVSLGARLFVHPRTIAAIHPEFTPVYNTAISQMETRDKHIAELGRGVETYNALPAEQKENVNKALELGRLMSDTFDAADLADGVTNTGTKKTVRVDKDGNTKVVSEPFTATLTAPGEVVKLNEDERKAYSDLREMFDQALDKFRDQTLTEFGFPELAGEKDAVKILDKMAKEADSDADAERLNNVANFVREIEQAKRTGYVPFARYGDYVVTVKEKVADLSFDKDGDGYIVRGVPADLEEDMLSLGGVRQGGEWLIPAEQRPDVAKLADRTVYSAKVETGLNDLIKQKTGPRDMKVDELPSVKAAIAQAEKDWVQGNPNRRIVAFPVRDKQPDSAVKLTDVDALAEIANIDNATWDAVRDKLATAIQGRSFRKHFFHSDNVPGYTGDFERAIADYVIGMAGYLSRRAHQKRWDGSLEAITDKGKLFQYASRYRDYVNSPQEEFAAIRQLGFFSYIAGVAATAFANMTQVPMLTLPTLAQVAPMPLVVREVTRAYKDAFGMLTKRAGLDLFDPNKAPDDVRAALKEAWDEGAFVPLETFDMMMTARQRNVGRRRAVKAFNDATKTIAIGFTFAERLNRLVTFMAAARLAEKEAVRKNADARLANDGLARSTVLGRNWNPKNFAEWAVDESQYRMGKANRPTTMRGVGAAIMQFKGFMLQTFEAWYRMAALHGKEGKYAAAASLVVLYALAGLWGMPGAEDLRKLIEAAYKAITDQDLDMKTELRAWIARMSGSNVLAQATTKGMSYPLGVDLTRVGMGTVAPDSPLAAAGIPFDMLIGRPKRAFEKGSAGDIAGAAGEFAPNFIKHWLVGGGWAYDGVRDKSGQRIINADQLSKTDIAMKMLGFQPSIVTDIRDYEYAQRRQETAVDTLKRKYAAQIARTIVAMEHAEDAGDTKKLDKLTADLDETYADIDEHNASAKPEAQIKIDNRTVRQRIQRERDGVATTWGKERKAAREGAEDLRGLFGLRSGE